MNQILDDYIAPNTPKKNHNRAHFGYRFLAFSLDMFLATSFLLLFVGIIAGFESPEYLSLVKDLSAPYIESNAFPFITNAAWVAIIINTLYASLEALTGASLGKRLLRIKIGTQDATIATKTTYFFRALLKNLNILLSALYIISGIELFPFVAAFFHLMFFVSCLAALNADRLALHDKLLGTAVYEKKDLAKVN